VFARLFDERVCVVDVPLFAVAAGRAREPAVEALVEAGFRGAAVAVLEAGAEFLFPITGRTTPEPCPLFAAVSLLTVVRRSAPTPDGAAPFSRLFRMHAGQSDTVLLVEKVALQSVGRTTLMGHSVSALETACRQTEKRVVCRWHMALSQLLPLCVYEWAR
jgi:hypothetical protein